MIIIIVLVILVAAAIVGAARLLGDGRNKGAFTPAVSALTAFVVIFALAGFPGAATAGTRTVGEAVAGHVPGQASSCTPLSGTTCSPLSYNGGQVEKTNANYLIFWGPKGSFPAGYQSLMKQFFNDVGGSGLYNNLTQYYETSGGTQNHIQNSTHLAAAVDDFAAFPKDCTDSVPGIGSNCVSQGDIESQIRAAIDNYNWPMGLSAMYWLFLPPGEGTCGNFFFIQKGCFGTGSNSYCAYHDFTTHYHLSGAKIVYAVMPYYGSAHACIDNPGTPNGNAAWDSELSGVSHELMEAVTDPLGDAWYGTGGQADEIGDKCNWDYTGAGLDLGAADQYWHGHYYLLQGEWSNKAPSNPADQGRRCVSVGPVPYATADSVPASGPPGDAITIDVQSASPGAALTAEYVTGTRPATAALCSFTVLGDGTGSCQANIPTAPAAGATGTHTITLVTGSPPTKVTSTHFTLTYYAYVANSGDNTVTPISTATNTAGTPIPVGANPQAIAVTPDGATVYVANSGDNTVTPISTATNTAGTPVPVGANPQGIAVTPDGATAYVTNFQGGTMTPINTATNTAGTPISVGSYPGGIAITPNGATAYLATDSNGGAVTPVNLTTKTAGKPIPIGSYPGEIAITPNGATAYVADGSNDTVTPINTATNTAGAPIPVGSNPIEIAITPNGATAYVVNVIDGTVTPISTATNTAGTPIPVGSDSDGIAITPDGATAYVANYADNTVTPISTATNTAGKPIPVGASPAGIATSYDGGF